MGKRPPSPSFSSSLTPNKFKKPRSFYIRTFDGDDILINVSHFTKGTTLKSAISSTLPDILKTGSLFAEEKDDHQYHEIIPDTTLNEIPSGAVIVPVYRLFIFSNKEFLIPRSFTGYELAQYIQQNYLPNLNSHQKLNFHVNDKEINSKISLLLQDIKDDSTITFLSSDEDEICLDDEENCENTEHTTTLSFEYISLCTKKKTYQIPSGTTFSQLRFMQKLTNSLIQFLREKHFTTIAHSDFELCYLDAKGRITPIPKSQQTVNQIPQPRILLWKYKHCPETFDKYLRSYLFDRASDKSKCLGFISETLCVVDSPEEKVFGPIYRMFNGTEIDDDNDELLITKLKDLIQHLKTKAQLFFDLTNYQRLIKILQRDYDSLSYVPN